MIVVPLADHCSKRFQCLDQPTIDTRFLFFLYYNLLHHFTISSLKTKPASFDAETDAFYHDFVIIHLQKCTTHLLDALDQ